MSWWTLRKLKSKEKIKKLEAIKKLRDLQDKRAVLPLIDIFNQYDEYDEEIWAAAAESLGKIKDEKALPYLFDKIANNDYAGSRFSIRALVHYGEGIIAPIMNKVYCQDQPEDFLKIVNQELSRSGKVAIGPLIDLIREPEYLPIPNGAANILNKIDNNWRKSEKAINVGVKLVSELENDPFDKGRILVALGHLQFKKAVQTIVNLKFSETDIKMGDKANAVWALSQMKHKLSIEYLLEGLKDEDTSIKEISTKALGKWKVKEAVNPLISLLNEFLEYPEYSKQHYYELMYEVPIALGNIGDKKAIEPLLKAIESEIGGLFENTTALLKIGKKEIIPRLESVAPKINVYDKELILEEIKKYKRKNK